MIPPLLLVNKGLAAIASLFLLTKDQFVHHIVDSFPGVLLTQNCATESAIKMVMLIILSAINCLLCLIIHLNSFLHFLQASEAFLKLLTYWNAIILYYPIFFVSKMKFSKADYRAIISSIIPNWIIPTFGLLIFYALANVAYYLFIRFTGSPLNSLTWPSDASVRVLSSLWICANVLVLLTLYNHRYIKKYGNGLIDSK